MAPKRKMLALVTEAWGGHGGIAQYNRDLIAALADPNGTSSIEVLPRFVRDRSECTPEGVIQHPPKLGKFAYTMYAFRRAVALKPDVIFCGHLYMAPLAQFITSITGAQLVVQLHGIEIWKEPTNQQRHALEQASLVLCVSRHTRRTALSYANIPQHRIRVQANTVSDEYTPGNREAARSSFGIARNAFCLLSVGRLDSQERYKGQDRVINALPELKKLDPNLLYLISGEGDDRPRLEALAQKVGVADVVRFLGQVPRENLADLYRAADLFTLPSTGEGFGIVFLEAMACGTPALGIGVSGARDALADGELGLAPRQHELEDVLATAISQYNRNDECLARAVNSRFGTSRFAARASELFAPMFLKRRAASPLSSS